MVAQRERDTDQTDVIPADDWHRLGLVQEGVEVELVALILLDGMVPEHLSEQMLERVAGQLEPEDFADLRCRTAYAAMLRILARGLRPDQTMLAAELRNVPGNTGPGAYDLVDILALTTQLGGPASGLARCRELVRIVQDAAAKRAVFAISQRAAAAVLRREQSAGDTMDAALSALDAARRRYNAVGGADDTAANAVAQYREMTRQWRETPHALRGTTTGLRYLDERTRGLHPSDLWVISARMGQLKTSLMLSMALAAARSCRMGEQVGIVSLEMTKDWLMHRMAAMLSAQSASAIEDGDSRVDWERVDDALAELEQLPIRIIDVAGAARRTNGARGKLTASEIGRHARAWHQDRGLTALYVDYLELIRPAQEEAKQSRDLQLAAATISLKGLAAELGVPVVLLAQAGRETTRRASLVPQLEDIRYSDEIAAAADVVIFPVWWDYYRQRGRELPLEAQNKPAGVVDLYLGKMRNRAAGMVSAWVIAERMQIVDYDDRARCPVDYNGRRYA